MDEAQQKLWGTVPLRCELAAADVTAGEAPPPLCSLVVPRQGYLYLHMDTVRDTFIRHVQHSEECFWLSFGERQRPVPWQFPVSAVLDILASETHARMAPLEALHELLPLTLTVHFTLPKKEDKRRGEVQETVLAAKADMARHFVMHRVKQAAALRFGTTSGIDRLPPADAQRLFEAVRHSEGAEWVVARRALEAASLPFTKGDVAIPVVVHVAGAGKDGAPRLGLRSAVRRVQGAKRSFGRVLYDELLPRALVEDARCAKAGFTKDGCYAQHPLPALVGRAVVQGLAPFLSTPMDALYEALATPDGFLHVVITPS